MVLLDLNTPAFQEELFSLERQDLLAVLSTLKKIRDLEWTQLYADRGLRWEAIPTTGRLQVGKESPVFV